MFCLGLHKNYCILLSSFLSFLSLFDQQSLAVLLNWNQILHRDSWNMLLYMHQIIFVAKSHNLYPEKPFQHNSTIIKQQVLNTIWNIFQRVIFNLRVLQILLWEKLITLHQNTCFSKMLMLGRMLYLKAPMPGQHSIIHTQPAHKVSQTA